MKADPGQSSGAGNHCGCKPPLSVTACFDRGRHRQRLPELPHVGRWIQGDQQLGAQFSLNLADDTLCDIRFRASTCITLVAYCELLCELARGLTPVATLHLCADQLVSTLPGVPRAKQDRATIAVFSLHSAVAASINTTIVETS